MFGKRKAPGTVIVDIVFYLLMIFLIFITLYPFINSLALSLNDSLDTMRGGITFYPRKFTFKNYELIFENDGIYNAYFITIARTAVGLLFGLFVTTLFSFALSHRDLAGRRFWTIVCIIPMYFSGGLIPLYFVIRSLGLVNNFFVYIFPLTFNLWNMILMRTFFQSMPLSLEESALIDGAGHFRVLFQIIIPIATPIIATIALFIGVFQWNSWFDAYIYITKMELKPMQSYLRYVISEATFAEQLARAGATTSVDASSIARNQNVNVRSITMATMIVTILPITLMYPFLQKYFVKGIMIGSLKG